MWRILLYELDRAFPTSANFLTSHVKINFTHYFEQLVILKYETCIVKPDRLDSGVGKHVFASGMSRPDCPGMYHSRCPESHVQMFWETGDRV